MKLYCQPPINGPAKEWLQDLLRPIQQSIVIKSDIAYPELTEKFQLRQRPLQRIAHESGFHLRDRAISTAKGTAVG